MLRDEIPAVVPHGTRIVQVVATALGQGASHYTHAGFLRGALQSPRRLTVRHTLRILFEVFCNISRDYCPMFYIDVMKKIAVVLYKM